MNKKTGVLIHGRHLQTRGWRDIVWGKPPYFVGQLPKGIAVAWEEQAQVVVLGTGAPEADGKKEAEYTRDFLVEQFNKLKEFTLFREIDIEALRSKINKIIQLETRSQNTVEEIRFAAEIFERHRVEKVILVSSPTHICRCLREALVIFEQDPRFSTSLLICLACRVKSIT